jgi:hypothetical protein
MRLVTLKSSNASTPQVRSDRDAKMQTVRRVGYALLIAAVVIDIATGPVVSFRAFARSQWSKAFDEALPPENLVIDLALAVLNSSDT